jgi:hypothetical protein
VPEGYYITEAERQILLELVEWWRRRGPDAVPPQPAGTLAGPIPFRFGKANEKILPGESGDVRQWRGNNAASSSNYDEDSVGGAAGLDEVHDFLGTGAWWQSSTNSEPVHVFRHQQSGKEYFAVAPMRRCKGLLTAALVSNSSSATVDNVTGLVGAPPTTGVLDTVAVENPYRLYGNDNAECRFEQHAGSTTWQLYVVARGYGRIRGLLQGAITTATTSFTMDNLVVVDGESPGASATVVNTHNWAGADNSLARAEWVQASSRWEAYQVDCT